MHLSQKSVFNASTSIHISIKTIYFLIREIVYETLWGLYGLILEVTNRSIFPLVKMPNTTKMHNF